MNNVLFDMIAVLSIGFISLCFLIGSITGLLHLLSKIVDIVNGYEYTRPKFYKIMVSVFNNGVVAFNMIFLLAASIVLGKLITNWIK